jgi:hypothetical protein
MPQESRRLFAMVTEHYYTTVTMHTFQWYTHTFQQDIDRYKGP